MVDVRPRIGVLISGRGSNLEALIDATKRGRVRAEIVLVVSNVGSAPGLERARAAGVPVEVLSHRDFSTRDAYDLALVDVLKSRQVDLVCLAGFMRVLGSAFCQAFPWAILNVHPSLLPAFRGAQAQRQAFEYGVKVTGATVHFVTDELDAGPIVMQRSVTVSDDDSAETLADRVLTVEREIYAEAVERVLHEPWLVVGRRVVFGRPAEAVR